MLVELARRWVVDHYPYNSRHLIRSLEWLDAFAPDSSESVRLAALTHDMERAFPPAVPIVLNDADYYRAHSDRSALIVGQWLQDNGASEQLVREVETLIRAHEIGGTPEGSVVQAADSLSFLETNVDLFLGFVRSGKYPVGQVRLKFEHTFERISLPRARELAFPLWQHAMSRLNELETAPTERA
jgi:hypothetical protein